jgi:hypothetical protein
MTTIKTTMLVSRGEPAGQQPLAQRFRTWRASRRRGERIPEELWQAATELARRDGLSATAAMLKLSYYDLKRRLLAGGASRRSGSRAPLFVEVPAVALSPDGGERGMVELVHAGGARLILHRCAAGSDELLPLVELFLRHGR